MSRCRCTNHILWKENLPPPTAPLYDSVVLVIMTKAVRRDSHLRPCKVRDAQIPSSRSSGRLNFVRWRQIFWGLSVWNLLRVILLWRRVLRWLLDFWKVFLSVLEVLFFPLCPISERGESFLKVSRPGVVVLLIRVEFCGFVGCCWLGKNLYQGHFVYHKSRVDLSGTEPRLAWWEDSDWLPGPRYGLGARNFVK